MNGIVVVDKPAGMTSAQVVGAVKRMLKVGKVGHTGTLDPLATGVLVCCVNQSTLLGQFFVRGKKLYEALMRLGVRTDTQDATGRELCRVSPVCVTADEIEAVFRSFVEIQEQTPPSFSALKHHGVPLYKLARQGILVEKPPRPVAVYGMALVELDSPLVRFEVCCSQGTYVRTLCADMGEALGFGAHLVALRRTESGGFGLEDAVSLEVLEEAAVSGRASDFVIPMNVALKGIPEIQVSHSLARWIRHGRPVNEAHLGRLEDRNATWIKVTDTQRDLVAIVGSQERDGILPYKCVFSETEGRAAC